MARTWTPAELIDRDLVLERSKWLAAVAAEKRGDETTHLDAIDRLLDRRLAHRAASTA